MQDASQNPDASAAGEPSTPPARPTPFPWLEWLPWLMAAGFATCCVVLLVLGFSLRRESQVAGQRLRETTLQAAELRQQLTVWQEESRKNTTGFQGRLNDFQRQVVQRTLDFERQKAALETELRAKTAEWTQEKAALQRQLAARSADAQALEAALTNLVAENNTRLDPMQVMLLRPVPGAASSAAGALVWDGSGQRGRLQVENLSPPPAGRDHQLWLHDPQYPVPISAGVLPPAVGSNARFAFKPLFPIARVSQVTITIERKGGADTPQGAVVMEGR